MRTTLYIDDTILAELKRLQAQEGGSLGRLVSELLARQLVERRRRPAPAPRFAWSSRPMGARVDVSDRDAVLDAMDEPRP
jgi:hypothetical protein